jgi:hypothetical protein
MVLDWVLANVSLFCGADGPLKMVADSQELLCTAVIGVG